MNISPVFHLINTLGAMQNVDREPLFCIQFPMQKVCPILYFSVFKRLLRQNINQIR